MIDQHLLLQMFVRADTPLYNFANAEPYSLLKEDFVGHVAVQFAAATQRNFNQVLAMPKVQGFSLTRGLEALADKGLIERDPGSRRYRVVDPVMTQWLKRNSALPARMD